MTSFFYHFQHKEDTSYAKISQIESIDEIPPVSVCAYAHARANDSKITCSEVSLYREDKP